MDFLKEMIKVAARKALADVDSKLDDLVAATGEMQDTLGRQVTKEERISVISQALLRRDEPMVTALILAVAIDRLWEQSQFEKDVPREAGKKP